MVGAAEHSGQLKAICRTWEELVALCDKTRLRYRYTAGEWDKILSDSGLEIYVSSVGWVLDIHHDRYLEAGLLATFDQELRLVNKVQALIDDHWWRLSDSRRVSLSMQCAEETDKLRASPREESPRPSYAVVVSALVLLSFVYQYLTGIVDRGGSKAYSRSSLDFRDIYIAILLFLGAYVWIKFREVAFKGVYTRKLKDRERRITKTVYEPRFKPPRENERIYLGQYATPEEASILYQIAAFYYNEDQCSLLDLEDGRWFPIPPMSEGERSLTGLERRAWVKVQVMKVYEEFKKEKAEAALVQDLLKAYEDEVPQERDEGPADSNGYNLGPQEGSALPVSKSLTSNAQSGMGICSSNQLDLLQVVRNLHELISYQQQQISLKDEQLQDCRAEISELKQQISLKDEQLQDYKAEISELKQQHYLQQLLQDINEGVPSNEVEME